MFRPLFLSGLLIGGIGCPLAAAALEYPIGTPMNLAGMEVAA